jgi:hypothetical protein
LSFLDLKHFDKRVYGPFEEGWEEDLNYWISRP